MFEGTVVSIYIAEGPGAEMLPVTEVNAVPGKGLEGDRYFKNEGTFSKPEPDRELTLIESEAIDSFKTELNLDFDLGASRRNVVTRGVPLNHLVGREFQVGAIRVRGLRLCEPCSHLAKLSDKRVLPGLVHRAGLRAQILTAGVIRPGDLICEQVGEL